VASTGVAGLDKILHGGFPRDEMHLIQGVAGTGKTTLALNFLRAGVASGEPALYVTLSQSRVHLERIARSHAWSLDGIAIHELSPGTVASRIAARQTVLPSADVELGELFRDLVDLVERVKPRRAAFDSVTILEMLAGTPQRYHREVVTLRQLFAEHGCTLLALADHPGDASAGEFPEVIFHPLCGVVINLAQDARAFGNVRRRLRVIKARGLAHNGGYHDFKIRTGVTEVFARLGAYEQPEQPTGKIIATGVEMLDRMLGGGLEPGTSCFIVGASGAGKSTIANLFAAAGQGPASRAAIFLFDERPEVCIARSEKVGLDVRESIEAGRLIVEQLDPGEIAPGEFAERVRRCVEHQQTRVIVLDSVVGYFAAMGSADVLMTQLHELIAYLTRNSVLLLMCGAQEGFMSIGPTSAVDISYLSDTIIALSFFETKGQLRRAVGIVKKKYGEHLGTIHEMSIVDKQLRIGEEPLSAYHTLVPRKIEP
jgi:circadian clock protein KaiC